MVRHATTELLHDEVERVAVPMPFDETNTNVKLCTDEMDTTFRVSKRQRLHDLAESCTIKEGSLSIRDPTPLCIELMVQDRWFSHAVPVDNLCPYESDEEEEEFRLCPSQSSGIGKRKRDTEDACEDYSSKTRAMRILVFVRLTPVDKLEPNVLLRAYLTTLFCGFFSLFSPSLLD